MGKIVYGLLAALLTSAAAGGALAAPSFAEPSLSPDGREIAFASGGDIWTAPAQGGTASLLVTDPATESRPLFSPDGARLAFLSTRGGSANIYILTLATGALKRLTWSDANEQLDGWSRDGRWLYFSSSAGDVARQNDIFRVSAEGGTPLEVSRERFLNEFGAAPSPDGVSVAFTAKGLSSTQWWRHGRSHIDETELWLKPVAAGAPYRRLMASEAKTLWPMWTPDGAALYLMSDRGGPENLWRLPLSGGAPEPVTRFTDGRVLWPSMSNDGRAIVFERDFGIWRLDTATGQASAVPITLRGSPAGSGLRHLSETNFQGMALSPDGLKVATAAHGEMFAASAKDGGQGQRLSETAAEERESAWSPDSRRLVYVSERGLDAQLVEYDFATGRERVLTSGAGLAGNPVYSPDGKRIAYVRAGRELRVLDPARKGPAADVAVFTGPLASYGQTTLTWSPDSRWLAFPVTDRRSFRNVHVVPAAGGDARPVSFLANGQTAGAIVWSPDGKFLVFDTAQRSEPGRLMRVDLLPNVPKHREDAFRELFKPGDAPDQTSPPTTPDETPPETSTKAETPARRPDPAAVLAAADAAGKPKPKTPAPAPVRIVFEGIRERASAMPVGLDAQGPVISPDGKTLVFTATLAGQENLFSYSLDELSKEPPVPQQLTSTKKSKRDYAFTPDSKSVFFLEGGTVMTTALETPKPKAVAITAEMDVDFDTEKKVVFDEAWGALNRRFYDPKFHGQDWAALRARWAPQIEGVRTPDELRRSLNLMIGELNASHSGVNRPGEGPGAAPGPRTGDLGLRFDRETYEAGRGLVVREVVALGPAALEGSIRAGDALVSVNGRRIERDTNLDSLLQYQVGKRVVLGVRSAGGAVRQAVVRPVGLPVASGLLYRQWVNDRRAYVEKISGGRLGYVHVADMGDASLEQLYIDLDAQNQDKAGVVVDLRNNNGGYVNGRVLDVFTRKNFLMMTQRDQFSVPSRQGLGQRALGSPTVLVVNESSLSDAEDFTEGYRALGVGKVVGVPTAGWIIYTSNEPLIDGSVVRLPQTKVEDLRGQNMELNPRPVDVRVERPLGETLAGRDAQLEAAVQTLLGSLPPAAAR